MNEKASESSELALKFLVLVVLVTFQFALNSWSSTPIVQRNRTPEEERIFQAARIQSPQERFESLDLALRMGLFESTNETRGQVLQFLWNNSRWIDFGPFEEVFREYDATFHVHDGLWFLDVNQLQRMRQSDRMCFHKQAIVNGQVDLQFGRPWLRSQATEDVAREGLIELEDLVREHYADLPSQFTERMPLEKFELYVELTHGGESLESSAAIAAERLVSIEAQEFADRMGNEKYFHDVVLEVAEFVCAVNPYDQSENLGCGFIRQIVALQMTSPALRRGDDPGQSTSGESSVEPVQISSDDETWIETLARLSGRKY